MFRVPDRTRELCAGSEMDHYAAFALEALRKTRARENVPSQEEIRAILARQDMSTTIYCHGGGSCKITINSHTTAGEVGQLCWVLMDPARSCQGLLGLTGTVCVSQVVEKLIRGLAMEDSKNMFALFEHNDSSEKAIESRAVVADVLAKFERYRPRRRLALLACFLSVRGAG